VSDFWANLTTRVAGGWHLKAVEGIEDFAVFGDELLIGASFQLVVVDRTSGAFVREDELGDGPGLFSISDGSLMYADKDVTLEFGHATEQDVFPDGHSTLDQGEVQACAHTVTFSLHKLTITDPDGNQSVLERPPDQFAFGPVYSHGDWLYLGLPDGTAVGLDLTLPVAATLSQLNL